MLWKGSGNRHLPLRRTMATEGSVPVIDRYRHDIATDPEPVALGKPVWILNRYDSCWRWLTGRDDSPWYPSARLFRQDHIGDWDGVVRRVRAELDRFSGAPAS